MRDDPGVATPLHPDLPYLAEHYVWAARPEMTHHVRDVLAYRTRAMFLHARAATQMAPAVVRLMAREVGHGEAWIHWEIDDAVVM